jgi:hypothetical protein
MTHNADPLEQLLRAAGPRATAPAERARRVEAAVRVEWEDAVKKRRGRRRAAWIAASCLTSAALIALALHAHAGPPVPQTPVSLPGPAYAGHESTPRSHGSYFRANNEDRPPDRGVPRHVLASYSWETR